MNAFSRRKLWDYLVLDRCDEILQCSDLFRENYMAVCVRML